MEACGFLFHVENLILIYEILTHFSLDPLVYPEMCFFSRNFEKQNGHHSRRAILKTVNVMVFVSYIINNKTF